MNYAEMLKLFNSRKKGRDYKVFRNSWEHIRQDPDSGALTLSNNCSVWEPDEWGKSHRRGVRPGTPVLRFTPDNVLEILHSPHATSLSDRLMIQHATGGDIWLRGKSFEHRLMLSFRTSYRDQRPAMPLVVGLKIDLNTGQPINKLDQIKRATNRAKAQPVYKHVREVGKVLDVLWRLGALDEIRQERKWGTLDIEPTTPVELTEEVLSTHAEQALRAGWNRGHVSRSDYDPATHQYKKRSDASVAAETYAKAREHGLKRLTEFLKPHHGAIVRTVVS